jgi:hypothetical protein
VTVRDFLTRLDSVRPRGTGRWVARCPVHQDTSPSLSIGEGVGRILIHCFASCEPTDIVAALSLTMADLFSDVPTPHGHRPAPKSVKIDRINLAFRFELAALDRRLRAERIIAAGKELEISSLSDTELDRALMYAAQAQADVERAELCETVADDLRLKAFTARDYARQERIA